METDNYKRITELANDSSCFLGQLIAQYEIEDTEPNEELDGLSEIESIDYE